MYFVLFMVKAKSLRLSAPFLGSPRNANGVMFRGEEEKLRAASFRPPRNHLGEQFRRQSYCFFLTCASVHLLHMPQKYA